ncbi:MAG: phosphate ABC transporter permease subunit PstC [Pseudonocardiaceae bacterium]
MATTAAAHPRLRPRSLPWPAALAAAAGIVALAAALAVIAFLLEGVYSGPVDWLRLLTSPVWDPPRGDFGAAAMVWGTVAVCAIALLIATPLGWAAAIGLTELTPIRLARVLRTGVELLAAIPSIVYGLVGIAVVRPVVSTVFGTPGGDGLLTAGVVLAVMVLPTVVAVSVDALAAVPQEKREAAAALGLTRTEVIRSAVLPEARFGMRAGVLLGLARALGETIAVFLVIGRADGRLPAPADVLTALVHPGQTLSTKLGGPEPVLAGAAGAHQAALSALGLLLFVLVAVITVVGLRLPRRTGRGTRYSRLRPRLRGRHIRDRVAIFALRAAVAVPLLLVTGILGVIAVRGAAGWDPQFWLEPPTGASGGGVRDQVLGTVVLVWGTAILAAPVGLGLGLLIAEYAGPRAARGLRTATVTLGGIPSILLGLVVYDLVVRTLGWGKSWLAGVLALTVLVVPVAATVTATRLAALPPARREAALALGLGRAQLARSVLVPWAAPGLLTGTLLGLARAAGETAPLLFAATVFAGVSGLPTGIINAPVVALPTHVFALAQDAADPAALDAAWGAALVLVLLAALLLLAAVPARRRMETDP